MHFQTCEEVFDNTMESVCTIKASKYLKNSEQGRSGTLKQSLENLPPSYCIYYVIKCLSDYFQTAIVVVYYSISALI